MKNFKKNIKRTSRNKKENRIDKKQLGAIDVDYFASPEFRKRLNDLVEKEYRKRVVQDVNTNITIADAVLKYATANTFPSALNDVEKDVLDRTTPVLPLTDLSLRKYENDGIPGIRYINILSNYSFLKIFEANSDKRNFTVKDQVSLKETSNNGDTSVLFNRSLLESADRQSTTLQAILGKSSAREIRASQLQF